MFLSPPSSEHVQSLVQVKVEVSMEVSSDKLMDLVLALCVQILKLVQVPLDIQTIGGQEIWFPLDEMFTFNPRYLAKNGNMQITLQISSQPPT